VDSGAGAVAAAVLCRRLYRSVAVAFVPLLLLWASYSATAAPPVKPLVVLFTTTAAASSVAGGVTATPTSSDGLLDAQRAQIAVRAVRDRFAESGVADAVIYVPDAPLFVRAALDAKLTLTDPASPTPAERLNLGKAIGALSVILITAQAVKDKPGTVQVGLEATNVSNRKVYSDSAETGGGSILDTLPGASSAPTLSGGGADTGTPQEPLPLANGRDNVWMTVSNTLVLRYLMGPLGEYTRALAPAGLAPSIKPTPLPTYLPDVTVPSPPAAPTPSPSPTPVATTPKPNVPLVTPPHTAAPATPTRTTGIGTGTAMQEAVVKEARQQADALIAGNDLPGAIVVLRRAVNLAPRSLPLRTLLARTYLSAGQAGDAAAEARRALTVAAPNSDRPARMDMMRLMADIDARNGDHTAARAAYEEILTAQPQAQWARLGLADTLLRQGDTDGAEAAYQAVHKAEPSNRDAVLGLARVAISRGDFNGAIAQIADVGGDSAVRLALTSTLFDEVAQKTADAVAQNRVAFDGGQLTREVIYKATTAQSARVVSLLSLLRASAPPADAAPAVMKPYRHRVFAATLLSQAVDGVLAYLEKGEKGAGDQATLLIGEFRKELAAAQANGASGAASATASADSSN